MQKSTQAKTNLPKSLMIASGLSLMTLTGCQTTTGVTHTPIGSPGTYQTTSSQQPAPQGSMTEHSSEPNAGGNTDTVYDNTYGNQPAATSPTQTRTDNPFESAPAEDISPIFTTPPSQTVVTPPPEPSVSSQPMDNSGAYIIQSDTPPPRVSEPKTSSQILIEQARQHSKQSSSSTSTAEDGDNLPAFRSLMNKGVAQLRQGQVSSAQSTFTRAQRLAPQSSAVYFYLGQVALKQNQPLKAEAMARRGLVVAKTASRKTALWQVILKAGHAQGNARVVSEAKAALSR